MWRAGLLLGLGLAISASGGAAAQPAPVTAPSPGDAAILHRLMAEGVMDRPLLPEPGNIWADAVPGDATTLPPLPRGRGAAKPRSADDRPVAMSVPAPRATIRPAAMSVPPPAAAPAQRRTASAVLVQLAAADTADAVMKEWHRLRQREKGLTNGHDPAIVQAQVKGHAVWRLRTGGFADSAAAGTFCARIRAAKGHCFVVPVSER